MTNRTHQVLTWVGAAALMVAVLLPLLNYVFEYSAPPEVIIVVGVLGVVMAGSRRVENVGVRFIKAWRGNE